MPGWDGTGPQGRGPMTGGRRGPCAGDAAIPGYGRGMGYARGGRGCRNQYYSTGLTGWQRAQMDESGGLAPVPGAVTAVPGDVAAVPAHDRLEQIEQRLDEVLARLTRLEGTE